MKPGPVAGWSIAYVYVLLIIGVLLIAGFFVIEFSFAEHPLIPFHALSRDVSGMCCVRMGRIGHVDLVL